MRMASLRGVEAVAPRPDWTPEQHGRFAAARDAAFLKAFAADRELRTAVRRFGSLSVRPVASAEAVDAQHLASDAAAAAAARSTASGPATAQHDGSACPAGEQAVDRPPRDLVDGGTAVAYCSATSVSFRGCIGGERGCLRAKAAAPQTPSSTPSRWSVGTASNCGR